MHAGYPIAHRLGLLAVLTCAPLATGEDVPGGKRTPRDRLVSAVTALATEAKLVPTAETPGRTTAGDRFGSSVSSSGSTVLVGAPADDAPSASSGSVYAFTRTGVSWSLQQKFTAADDTSGGYFGYSVSVSGDTAVVGAPLDDPLGVSSGSAYVFLRTGTKWTQQQKLFPSDGGPNDNFGSAVSLFGDTLVIGAPFDGVPTSAVWRGSAYVFVRSGGIWTEQQKLVSLDAASGDQFGTSVSVGEDTIVVGARDDDVGLLNESGSACVFLRSGTLWQQQQKLVAPDGAPSDHFGAAVSLAGETVLVGAPGKSVGASTSVGAAYVFVRSGVVWQQQEKLLALDGAASDGFGAVVALLGDRAAVGAAGDDVAGTDSGSAWFFSRAGGVWSLPERLSPADGGALDYFGSSVSVSADFVVSGAPYASAPYHQSGAAYVFAPDAVPPLDPPVLFSTSHSPSAWSNVRSVTMEWSGATDNGTLAGYSVLFDAQPSSLPDAVVDVPQTTDPHTTVSPPQPDGNDHHFHLRTCDSAANCTATLHRGPYWIDGTPPGSVSGLTSTSHGVGVPSADDTIDVVWAASVDALSGVDGYAYEFNANPSWVCDEVMDLEQTATGVTSPSLGPGSFHAHVCARDNAGNWSSVTTAGPYDIVSTPLSLYTLPACRVIDTRTTDPPPLSAGVARTFAIAGHCGIPSTAKAISYNLVVAGPSEAGNCRLYPEGTILPLVSSINYSAGQTRSNNGIVSLGAAGGITIRCDQSSGTTHLALDVNAYFE